MTLDISYRKIEIVKGAMPFITTKISINQKKLTL